MGWMEDRDLVLTVEEAGRALKICTNSVYRGVQEGTIPSVRIGRRILIPRAKLEQRLLGVDVPAADSHDDVDAAIARFNQRRERRLAGH